MRVIAHLPHPTIKITVFKNDGRFPIQFERDGLSQIYRFRESDRLRGLDDVKKLLTDDLLLTVQEQFRVMAAAHSRALATFAPASPPDPLDGLPDII